MTQVFARTRVRDAAICCILPPRIAPVVEQAGRAELVLPEIDALLARAVALAEAETKAQQAARAATVEIDLAARRIRDRMLAEGPIADPSQPVRAARSRHEAIAADAELFGQAARASLTAIERAVVADSLAIVAAGRPAMP